MIETYTDHHATERFELAIDGDLAALVLLNCSFAASFIKRHAAYEHLVA